MQIVSWCFLLGVLSGVAACNAEGRHAAKSVWSHPVAACRRLSSAMNTGLPPESGKLSLSQIEKAVSKYVSELEVLQRGAPRQVAQPLADFAAVNRTRQRALTKPLDQGSEEALNE